MRGAGGEVDLFVAFPEIDKGTRAEVDGRSGNRGGQVRDHVLVDIQSNERAPPELFWLVLKALGEFVLKLRIELCRASGHVIRIYDCRRLRF
jgi:hypothetical protein